MEWHKNYIIQTIAVGVITLILMSVAFFIAGRIIWFALYDNVIRTRTDLSNNTAGIEPSGLVDSFDKKTTPWKQSSITATLGDGFFSQLIYELQSRSMAAKKYWTGNNIIQYQMLSDDIYCAYPYNYPGLTWRVLYFDRSRGLFVNCDIQRELADRKWIKSKTQYIGPEGSSDTPDDTLGRFSGDLVKANGSFYWNVFFDKEQNRFFSLDPNGIKKGPQLNPEGEYHPFEFGEFPGRYDFVRNFSWNPPDIRKEGENRSWNPKDGLSGYSTKAMLVLDESGRFDWLDLESLEYRGPAGNIPFWPGVQYPKQSVDKWHIAALPFTVDREPDGLILAVGQRPGLDLRIGVFDKNGKLIKTGEKYIVLNDLAGGVAYEIGTYLLKNLHPPIILLISPFIVSVFHSLPLNVIFLLWLHFFLITLPALLLGVFFAWRVARDARSLGFNRRARKIWIIATIAFSLVGYITYRLTRPDVSLVTCPNCGKGRRPDRELCHHCQSYWLVPENIAPLWRVFDADSQQVTDEPL